MLKLSSTLVYGAAKRLMRMAAGMRSVKNVSANDP